MTRTIYRERIPSTDPRLKRHILHDSESRRYAFDTTGLTIQSVEHPRHIPFLDQGQVGSCTSNAGVGNLGTEPLWGTESSTKYTLDEAGALRLYSDEEVFDGNGPYPPNDYGSSGLTCAKVLKAAGLISGFQWTFSFDDMLKALQQYPVMIGVNFYNDGFTTDPDGRIRISGGLAGGHEMVVRKLVVEKEQVWPDNSWGLGFGINGMGYYTFDDMKYLLAQRGDCTVLLPLSVPTPQPPASKDDALKAVAVPWVAKRHVGSNNTMAKALKVWLAP